mgnify:CR=1 FL=1
MPDGLVISAPEHLFKASLQIDLHDGVYPDTWRSGYYMRPPEKKILLKSDYLRKEAELYINYISQGENIDSNKFMCKALKEVNEGGRYLNQWVYEQSLDLIKAGKLVGLVGGDHSTPLGFMKAISEVHPEFGVLQMTLAQKLCHDAETAIDSLCAFGNRRWRIANVGQRPFT